jgi:hypothetical protein
VWQAGSVGPPQKQALFIYVSIYHHIPSAVGADSLPLQVENPNKIDLIGMTRARIC